MKVKVGILDHVWVVRADAVLYSAALIIPLVSHAPQLLTGSVINMLLFIGAKTLTRRQLAALIVLPSLGALMNGVLFASLTPYLIYLMPFIWLSNGVLIWLYQILHKKFSQTLSIGIAAVAKTLVLFLVAQVMFGVGMVPVIFLTAMGVVQLVTALAGGMLALGVEKTGVIKYE